MTGRTSCRDNAVPTASPYVNHFEVAHNPFEFLIEFGQFRPGKDEGEGQLDIHTVLAISPSTPALISRKRPSRYWNREASDSPDEISA